MKRFLSSIEPLESRIAPAFAAVIDISSLVGTDGFKISGVAAGDQAGSVSDAGDVNGDGFDDVIIGAPHFGNGADGTGASYVVFGKAGGFTANLNLSTLNGSNGFKIGGFAVGGHPGISVSTAGDVNDDGFDDVIIGAPGTPSTGASYVIFGKASAFSPVLDVATLSGGNGFKVTGAATGDGAGYAVSAAGDVNGDGFDDVIIGASGADPNGSSSGASYVIFGKASGFAANLNLSSLNGANGFKLSGAAAGDSAGGDVRTAGDVNGDGFDDLIIGALYADPHGLSSGAGYVVFGHSGAFASNLNLSALDGSNGLRLSGAAAGDFAGFNVSGAGDINGDGIDDVIVGAPKVDSNGSNSGASYVVFGKRNGFAADLNLSSLDGSNGFKLSGAAAGDGAGYSVSTAGDLNGDGFDDVIIGASLADPHGSGSGASYVVFGKASGFVANLNLFSLNGTNGFKLSGVATNDFAGQAVSAAGDVNGDGFDDVIIGALGADPHGESSGASYVVFGRGPELSISDSSVIEGESGTAALQFTVSLSEPGINPVIVGVATNDGTALAGSDYTPIQMQLTFAPDEMTKTVILNAIGGTLFENDETFSVRISSENAVIRKDTGIGTILNDDAPPLVSIADASVIEGDSDTSNLLFTVSLSQASGLPVTVNFSSADGTALGGSDYTPLTSDTLTFAPGETTKTITIDVVGDTSIEDHEQFSVVLSEPIGGTLGSAAALGTIQNNDTSITINDASVLEGHAGNRPITFTVSLSAPTALPVSVTFSPTEGTATAGADYLALAPGTLNFAPGETSKTITVDVLGDIAAESSETFSATLFGAINAMVDDSSAIGTILNDDVTLVSKRVATFTDVDGDLIKIRVSKGTLKVEDFILFPSGNGSQLALVDLSEETEFAGADLSITARRAPGTAAGIRSVDVGVIDASGIDLGHVMIEGDLGRIDAGNDVDKRPGLVRLDAHSLGARDLTTQLPGGSLRSDILGTLNRLELTDGMQDVILAVRGDIGGFSSAGSVLGSTICSDGKIGLIKITGDLADSPSNPLLISAAGDSLASSTAGALAISGLWVSGSVKNAQILAGYDTTKTAINGDAGVGSVTIGGDWIASDLVAGTVAGADQRFGTADDAGFENTTGIASRIAAIVIKGAANGTDNEADHFGFVAQLVGAFKAGGSKLKLLPDAGNDLTGVPVGATSDLTVREVA